MYSAKYRLKAMILAGALAFFPIAAYAQSSSPNYKVEETFFGTGGELDASSPNYQAKQTAGELVAGNTSSANYQAFAGFNTTDEPYLEFVVTGANIDLGYLGTGSVSSATGVFSVRAWQAHGYSITTESDPPTNSQSGYMLSALSTPSPSSPGTEQFGINLVDNSSPDVGANLQQIPDGSFSSGEVATGYDTANSFKYAKGDTIALSNESTSITQYTISYIFNISDITPSGEYVFAHNLVATGTY